MHSDKFSWRTRVLAISPGVLDRTREILLSGLAVISIPVLFFFLASPVHGIVFGLTPMLVSVWSLLVLTKVRCGTYAHTAWVLLVLPTVALGLLTWLMVLTESIAGATLLMILLGPVVFGSVFAGWQVMQINRRLGRGETLESMGLRTADSSVDEGEVREDAHAK